MFSDDRKLAPDGHRRDGKKTLEVDEGKKRREEISLTLRKSRRDDLLNKKRREEPMPSMPSMPSICSSTDITESNIGVLVSQIHTEDPTLQLSAAVNFRKLLSIETAPPIDEIVKADGVVKRLVSFLQRDENTVLQFEAAWALTNIASGTSEHTRVVIQSQAVPQFIRLLRSQAVDVQEQAVWALGNIAGDGHKFRDYILTTGGMIPLLEVVRENPKQSVLRNCVWTISNLCRGKPHPPFEQIAPALPVLAELLEHADVDAVSDACWALSYITDGPSPQIQAVIDIGVVPRLIELLSDPGAVQTPALRIIGNFVTGNDQQTQIVINSGGLRPLRQLLTHDRRTMRKEACWAISNITAGPPEQIQAVIDADIFPQLLQALRDSAFDVRKEAAWAVSNATSSLNLPHIEYIVSLGVVPLYLELLQLNDARIGTVALDGLDNILQAGQTADVDASGTNAYAELIEHVGGLRIIEDLMNQPQGKNAALAEKAQHLLETFFEERDDAVGDVGADQYGQAQGYGMEGQQQPEQMAASTAFAFGQPAQLPGQIGLDFQ
eukprot:TRINITY_DN68020_c0_g1_i1.p1 TRINITY_DN68020_c0_g1~~TRINITY_DN68020_c0_g1_i1.p1  ORF type:complete len:551 (+),score=116.67 TRINITY_DN68020_c0_g1_i1:121-1773(+)